MDEESGESTEEEMTGVRHRETDTGLSERQLIPEAR